MTTGHNKIKILHLEDQPSDADLVARILRNANITSDLMLVSTREEYTTALEEFAPELVLSDHNLPAFNSMEAMGILRKSNLNIPFVLVTGTVSEEFAVEAMRAGADDYILKDRPQRLPIAVANALQTYQIKKEQEEAETRIKESEAKYRSFFENSMDGILLTVTDGQILAANPAACGMFNMTEQEICEAGRFGLVDPTDPRVMPLIEQRQLTGQARGEITLLRKDGSTFSGEVSSSLFIDAYGNERTSMIIRDITNRKVAEEKIASTTSSLQKALGELKKFMDSSLDMICAVDEAGYFLQVSAACETILGYTPDELIGKKIFNYVYPEDLNETEQSSRDVMAGNALTNFENRYVRKDGSLVTISWSTRWDKTERIRYGVARDVTKLKNAEKVIASERKRLSDLFMNAPVSMCITSGKDHVFELANPIYLELAGKDKEHVIGKSGSEVFPELEAQGALKYLDAVYDSGQPFKANEMEFKIDLDGNGQLTPFYQNILQQPYRDVEGNVAGLFYFGVDVTEQVLARRKIEEAEKRYRQIVETAQEGMWVVDEHDKTTFVNKKMCELFEYTHEEMIGKPIYAFMDDEGKEIAADLMQKRRDGKSGQGHFKYISKTGREIWTNVSANPLFREDGSYEGALAMITDITEQKKIEEENKKLSAIASLTVNAVIVADIRGRITWVNEGFERMTEYTFDEAVGKKPGHLLQGPNTDSAVSQYMGECTKSGQGFRVEILNYSKSGRQYWVDIEARPLHDGKNRLTGFMAIEQDITERKKFQDTLVRRDSQLTLAAQIAGLGYWEYDVLNDLFIFNDQFYNVYKTTAEAVGGYSMSAARYTELFLPPDEAEIVGRSVEEATKAVDAQFTFKAEHRIIYANGEIGFVSVHFRIIKDKEGRTIKHFGVNQDITERKEVELERMALIDGLQNKNKDLQQFSYIVSHNLRAPIAKIMGLVSVIESESEENNFLFEKLAEEAVHLDDVVKDINTIVSARKSKNEILELVSFQKELNLIQQVLEDDILESGATIVEGFSAAPELWTIKSYLYSILYNLVSNAIKYRKQGTPLHITVKSSQDDKFICLSVQDNGEGIDLAKNGDKIFGLYKRFHIGNVPGKGIGLSLVKTHAESLGGRVEIESELTIGTTFRVYIPKYNQKKV